MTKTLKYIAVDDEPLAISKIDEFAGQVSFLEKIADFNSGIDAIAFLKQAEVDLVFMDINMEGLDGLQTIELMGPRAQVIISTAYSQHALRGFDLDVCDYLLKPFSFERFVKAVSRAWEKHSAGQANEPTVVKPVPDKDYIFLRTSSKIRRILLQNIRFIKGLGDYLEVNCGEERILVLMSFEEISKLLPHNDFIRVHRSYIINVQHIDSIERNHVQVGNESIPISQSYREGFFQFVKC